MWGQPTKFRWRYPIAALCLVGCASTGTGDESGLTAVSDDPTPTDLAPAPVESENEPLVTEPPATEPPVTEPPVSIDGVGVVASWAEIEVDSQDCMCSDGSEFSIFERPGNPKKVMFYFEGGGACFNLATCDPNGDPTYSIGIADDTAERLTERGASVLRFAKPTFTKPAPVDLRHEIATSCDAVIEALAD